MRPSTIRMLLSAAAVLWQAAVPATAADTISGRDILQRNCGRCHGVVASMASPLSGAPNLPTVLGNYPYERLDAELSEGIGSRHKDMPQIQFTPEEVDAIYRYLHGRNPDAELRGPQ